jgi:alkylhydroperoxidase/carboxymuconolactone decarboxylase family protein YurZ
LTGDTGEQPPSGDDWEAEWVRMVGRVSEVASDVHDMNPTAEESYRRLRSWIYDERTDGLSRAHKELVMVVMNLAAGYKEGAVRHLNNGLKHGLTVTEVRETLSLGFLFLGVINYLRVGQALWQACAEGEATADGG